MLEELSPRNGLMTESTPNPYRAPQTGEAKPQVSLEHNLPVWSWWLTPIQVACTIRCDLVVATDHILHFYKRLSPKGQIHQTGTDQISVERGSIYGSLFGRANAAIHRLNIQFAEQPDEQLRIEWNIGVKLFMGLVVADDPLIRECRKVANELHAAT